MTIKRAYNITRNFIHNFRDIIPQAYSNIEIYQNGHRSIIMKLERGAYRMLGESTFKRDYLNNNYIKLENIEEDDHLSYIIKEEFYNTSVGLVSLEDFYLAEDIIDTLKFITPKNLEIGRRYKSITDKEYLALGDVEYINGIVEKNKRYNLLYDLKLEKIVKMHSIKLVEELEYNNDKYKIDLFKNYWWDTSGIKVTTKIDNITFMNKGDRCE